MNIWTPTMLHFFFSSFLIQTQLFCLSFSDSDIHLLFPCFFLPPFSLTFHSLSQILLHLPLPKALSLPDQHCHTPTHTHSQSHINTYTSLSPHPLLTPVLHFSFRRLSLQLQWCSQLASCQGLGAVYLWLCYHIALPVQLSPVRTKRNPVSYCPLMFNETGV